MTAKGVWQQGKGRWVGKNRDSSVENLKEKNNFSHFARRERSRKRKNGGKRDKKQIVLGAGHTDGAIMQRFVASADKK